MHKILIANRGEIACRIIETCKKLNILTVAVYSDADITSKHVRLADESIYIGKSKAQESYLSSNTIISAALKSKADAIHPGFGFLSENDNFAQQVIDSGIVWIGPKPDLIKSMGNKDKARELAINSNLPVCPGLKNNEINDTKLEDKCQKIGYPILIKASAGGGGIGMQIAKTYEELIELIKKTKSMAKKSFGNSDVFLEKYISNARHIEIQVFGLGENKAIHFYERDCSLQRRFQKIIEECPAPNIKEDIINKMAKDAVEFTSNQKYEGAGTVEFIYDLDQNKYYFLEMNTRIQVEHPVTESVTKIDLVELQIRYALNLNFHIMTQYSIKKVGHSIECRLYAEDPSKNFLPSPGKIIKLRIPKLDDNIRLDLGVGEGDTIPFYYDPMIAKIISIGNDREEAINILINFLLKFKLEGISTNQNFLVTLLQDKTFKTAKHNTKFIEMNLDSLTANLNTALDINKKIIKKKNNKNILNKKYLTQSFEKYTEKDENFFEKIISQSSNKSNLENYTESDLKAFDNITTNNYISTKGSNFLNNNFSGKIYEIPKFLIAGDKYMLIEFGNIMNLELNFMAQNLAQAIQINKIKGVYETAPSFASMLIHYDPDKIRFNDLKKEIQLLYNSFGKSDNIEISSRVFSFPTVYLDKWTEECINDYSLKIAKKTPDPEFIVELNNLEDTDQFVRVHSGTEYWVAALGFWPGLPFMMPLDPRCILTAPKYNPPRTWTPKGTVGMGGSSTAIYPDRLPGGYQIFGIIPVPIWDTQKKFSVFDKSICLFKPGDRVKFIPTTYEEFESVSDKVNEGTYDYNIIEYQKFSVKNYKEWLKKIDKNKRF